MEYRPGIRSGREAWRRILAGTYGISYGRSRTIRSNVKSDPTAGMSLDAAADGLPPLPTASELRARADVTVNGLPSRSVTHVDEREIPLDATRRTY